MTVPSRSIEIDIPCDPQQMGELAMPFALLSEAPIPLGSSSAPS
jgi:hypothetical protein